MKTIDERSDAYIHENARQEGYDAEDVRTAYIDGAEAEHELLTRWHDPKEELPSPGQPVIICTSPRIYFLASYDVEFGDWFAGDAVFSRCEIIGWREIHE
ncbi:hypothetical protein [Alistipes sp.]|uniref:hypothetical protein n=1 Tax=Alistipes sp. TaxID=1872444 RepID=UPI003AB20297